LRSPTILSHIIAALKGDEYTHAALSLDYGLDYMFSFGRRHRRNPFVGCFKHERVTDKLYGTEKVLPGAVMELAVTQAQYDMVAGQIERFLLDNHRFGYNYLGLVRGIWGGSAHCNRRFLCSEFVYHVLSMCNAADLQLPPEQVRPQDLLRVGREIFKGDLKAFVRLGSPLPLMRPRIFGFG
jgi:hypothetical protein